MLHDRDTGNGHRFFLCFANRPQCLGAGTGAGGGRLFLTFLQLAHRGVDGVRGLARRVLGPLLQVLLEGGQLGALAVFEFLS
jgi:hypothetical protein